MKVIFKLSDFENPTIAKALDDFRSKVGLEVSDALMKKELEVEGRVVEPDKVSNLLYTAIADQLDVLFGEIYQADIDELHSPHIVLDAVEKRLAALLKSISEEIVNSIETVWIVLDPSNSDLPDEVIMEEIRLDAIFDEVFIQTLHSDIQKLGSRIRSFVMMEMEKLTEFAKKIQP